ncbi:nucleotidyltransferase [Periweissella cryptocerci]|uniref:tRNA(Met) cytidine acetate ligase n=1 Tax=Periweissella cryptocerci TaxID=2506420 RepID=A0A4P6YS65_9LACO|nr:nucleotidyltransferase [Periweissella cryptocerci]QBO35453.1 nucleotidyltransferase [Periweissella cryptocerci]
MLKNVALITEYNPFHNGHLYHLQLAKRLTNADVVIVMMSGNYVQRGEPALFDKWTRTNEALQNGADLVFELPFSAAVQPAHLFARGAVEQLMALGVSEIVFGVEHAEYNFLDLARKMPTQAAEFQRYNQTFASAFNTELAQATGVRLDDPNDILAFGYARAIIELNADIKLTPIQRVQAGYHDDNLPEAGHIASATAIRMSTADVAQYVPQQTAQDLALGADVTPFSVGWWPLLRYRLQTTSAQDLAHIYQMNEGLEHRIKEASYRYTDFASFMDQVKTKRFTYARIQRVLLYTLLNVTDDDMHNAMAHPMLHLLGYSNSGQTWLRTNKKDFTLPLISKVNRELRQGEYELQYRVDSIYGQLKGDKRDQNIGRVPLRSLDIAD